MIFCLESIPDPYELKEYVPTGAGYLQGGLQRENWERAITSITKMTVKRISHPGINFLIKHVGSILRRLFSIALEDVKHGDELSATFKLVPTAVESHLVRMFDDMLWELMVNAAEKSHLSLEPMYSSLDPTLPTFLPLDEDTSDAIRTDIHYQSLIKETPSKKEVKVQEMMRAMVEKIGAAFSYDGQRAKEILRNDARKRISEKSTFLPDERSSMITKNESTFVISRAFQYIMALLEFNNVMLRFQMNHYLYEGFKTTLNDFSRKVLLKDWSALVEPNESIKGQIKNLEDKITGLTDSLDEVKRIQSKF